MSRKVPALFLPWLLVLVISGAGRAAQGETISWDRDIETGDKACQAGHYDEAESLYKMGLDSCRAKLGRSNPAVARCCVSLAALYKQQKKYSQAEELYKEALSIREKGPRSNPTAQTDLAASLDLLAGLYRIEGRDADAEPLFKRSIAITDKVFGVNSFAAGAAARDLAALYTDKKQYEQAAALYQRIIARTEKKGGPDCPILTPSLNSLATIYSAEGKYDQAEKLIKRAIAIEEAELGPKQPHLAVLLETYASILRRADRENEAEKMDARIKIIKESVSP
ncbi:MAG: tetratricopeptide repeat protein [Cyanobacteria bacterium SZAS LIN-2]|nr:tetratricopeptide repeat protein [Cyanobacteria bacterium SZAS LIN-2]